MLFVAETAATQQGEPVFGYRFAIYIIIIIIDNVCIVLFSGVPKLTALYILQHFLSFTNIIHNNYYDN